MVSASHPACADSVVRPWDFPAGARLVIAFEFCERMGFYSMVSLLALYLAASRATGGFGWSRSSALSLLGVYSGLMYALPVAGGWVADHLLGYRRALAIGGSIMFSAYVALTTVVVFAHRSAAGAPLGLLHPPSGLSPALEYDYRLASAGFWAAMAGLVLGCAVVKSTLVVILGDSFTGNAVRREAAYAYYYAGINLGGFIAGIAAGSIASAYGWAPAFGISAVAMAIAMIAYALFGHHLPKPLGTTRVRPAESTFDQRPEEEAGAAMRLGILGIFAVLLLVYEIGSFQLWGTMSFLEHSVNRHVGTLEIPTQWFTSIESAALILAAPVFAALWTWLGSRGREPDIVIKYALALLLGAGGLLLFAAAAWPERAAGHPGWLLPALGIAIQAIGEVAAWTVSYGLVYRLSPRRIVAAVMGAFYALTLGLGGYLAGWLGRYAVPMGDAHYFLTLAAVTAAVAIAAVAVGPALRALAAASGAALRVE